MMRHILAALALTATLPNVGFAQARVVSAPPDPSFVGLTGEWGRASMLGDLRELRTGSDYLELRMWGGFTLRSRTQAAVLRRSGGHWSAFLAQVMRCEIQIPTSVGDTASRLTMQRYIAEARHHCGTAVTDVGPGAQIITADSLRVDRLDIPDSTIESAWTAAERAGVSDLPPRVERSRTLDDPFTYVVELRRGNQYRASQIEHVEPDETDADRRMKAIYAAANRVLPPELILKP